MARCCDFPCCGHELGCCPDYDESGQQLNMKCVCGATLPLNSRFSCCPACMCDPDEYEDRHSYPEDDDDGRDPIYFEDEDQEDFNDEEWPMEDQHLDGMYEM